MKGQLEHERRMYQQQLVEIAAHATAGVQAAWAQGSPPELANIAIEYAEELVKKAGAAALAKFPEESTSSAGHEEKEPLAQ